jgi:hypothetical protein
MKLFGESFLQLNWKDVLKGFILAVLSALTVGLYQAVELGTIEFTWIFWNPIVMTSIGAGLAYLIKNFFTNSEDKFLTKEG